MLLRELQFNEIDLALMDSYIFPYVQAFDIFDAVRNLIRFKKL